MNRAGLRIPLVVAAKNGENPFRRKGEVSSAMFVSRGLVDPKSTRNSTCLKGKQVNIPVPQRYARQRKSLSDTSGQAKLDRRPI